jgi:hypothetical protein
MPFCPGRCGWLFREKIEAQAQEMRLQKDVNASLEARLAKLEASLLQTKAAALQ